MLFYTSFLISVCEECCTDRGSAPSCAILCLLNFRQIPLDAANYLRYFDVTSIRAHAPALGEQSVPTTTINENITMKGLDNIQETIEVKPLSLTETVEVKPLNVTTKSDFAITQPIVTDSKAKSDSTSANKLEVDLEPIKIESDQKSAIDVKPLAIDSCQTMTMKLAPLPPTSIDQPYNHHFGITFMGVELWGLNLHGRSGMVLENPQHRQFQVALPSHRCQPCTESKKKGLRVRVGP